MVNNPKPPLGIGKMQPVPVIAVISDLGGAVKGLHVAAGIYAPNAYPFRDMSQGYVFGSDAGPPPPSRYDILTQEAAVLFPSLAASYRINDMIDVGARVSWGLADLHSKTTIWGTTNFSEWIEQDGVIDLKAKDNFVPAFGVGATFRPTANLEFGVNYTSAAQIRAKGTVESQNGDAVNLGGEPIVVGPPPPDVTPRCAAGGTATAQKACVDLDLPMSAQLGGRYKFLDSKGNFVGDVELDLDWQNWSTDRASNYRVVVDAYAYVNDMPTLDLKDSIIHHGLKDTFAARLGGSYRIPLDEVRGDNIVVRGGVGFDTAAAKTGFLRADLDGAARTTITAGAGYKAKTWEVNVGGGVILEGTNTNPGDCNPVGTVSPAAQGCDGTGFETPVPDRTGVDPSNPAIKDNVQNQSPVNQGKFESHYVLFMLGFTKTF
ncbi:MAG: outer membrane protein transport protein [Proteobacteria bacterium]|nr:outer membrane protein transport protein [Pseudomonadota bacterium]